MRRSLGITRLAFACWMAIQACATYDNPPLGSAGGRASSAGDAGEGGSAPQAAGNAGVGNSAGEGRAGSGVGGSAGESAGAPSAGGTGEGGSRTTAGEGGVGASAGAAGSDGAGAGGGSACESTAPEASCACVAHEGHDYWFCPTFLTFGAAEAKCKAVSMHLPKVESESEDDWLFASAALASIGEYFLGATDEATPNEWSWLAGGKFWSGVADGTAFGYANWSANEPNASGDCLVVQSNGPWDDRICTDQRKYVCEQP